MATARLIREAYDKALAPLSLNLTTASMLAYVAERGPTTQTVLADRMGIDIFEVIRAAASSPGDWSSGDPIPKTAGCGW